MARLTPSGCAIHVGQQEMSGVSSKRHFLLRIVAESGNVSLTFSRRRALFEDFFLDEVVARLPDGMIVIATDGRGIHSPS